METDAERDQLAAVEYDEVQGYLFAVPLPPAEIARLWETRSAAGPVRR